MQIEGDVIQTRRITSSKICTALHIIRQPNSIFVLLFTVANLTGFSVNHISSKTQGWWSVRLRKTAAKLNFQERTRKLPFSPGDPGVESRVTKKDGEVRYDR